MSNEEVAASIDVRRAKTLRAGTAYVVVLFVGVSKTDDALASGSVTVNGPTSALPSRIANVAWGALAMNTSEVVVAIFPLASVAVHVTVVVPSENEFGLWLIAGVGSTRSVEVAFTSVGVVEVPIAVKDWSAGAVIEGDVVSTTLTLKVAVLVAMPSSAAQVIVVVLRAKRLPEGGAQETVIEVLETFVVVALTLNVTIAPVELAASAVISVAPVIVGTSASACNVGSAANKANATNEPTNKRGKLSVFFITL